MSIDFIVRIRALDRGDLTSDSPLMAADAEDQEAEEARVEAFQAKYHATDSSLRISFPSRGLAVLIPVLIDARAAFDPPPGMGTPHHASDGEAGPRGPNGEVPTDKLCSNDGRHVTREEAAILHERLSAVLERGVRLEARGYSYDLREAATDPDDRATWE